MCWSCMWELCLLCPSKMLVSDVNTLRHNVRLKTHTCTKASVLEHKDKRNSKAFEQMNVDANFPLM